jgi:hypothetical protein
MIINDSGGYYFIKVSQFLYLIHSQSNRIWLRKREREDKGGAMMNLPKAGTGVLVEWENKSRHGEIE